MSERIRVFFCPDPSLVESKEFVSVARRGLEGQGYDVDLRDPTFGAAFVRDRRRDEGLLCFVPADLRALECLAEEARLVHRDDGRYRYMGVVGLGGSIAVSRSPEWRRAFGALTAAGFHVSHPEMIDGRLVWDPVRVGDFCLHPEEHSIRYGSRQVGDTVPDEVLEACYPVFRSAIAQIFGAGLFDGLTDGAVAVRLPDGRIVVNGTKTAKAPSHFSVDDMVLVEGWDEPTNTVSWSGSRPPSSGTVWYWGILSRRQDVQAMVHTHCRAITYSAEPEARALCAPTFAPYGGTAGLDDLLGILSESPVAILRAHGAVAIGRSLDEGLDHVIALRQRVGGGYFGPP